MINSSLTDDPDIMKQTRSLYARANMIIRKSSECSFAYPRLCYSELTALHCMAVSFGLLCFSTRFANYVSHIMIHLNFC